MPCTALCYMAFYFFQDIYSIEYKKEKSICPFKYGFMVLYSQAQGTSPKAKHQMEVSNHEKR